MSSGETVVAGMSGSTVNTVKAAATTGISTGDTALAVCDPEAKASTWCDLSSAVVGELGFTDSSAKTGSLTAGNYLICADQHCHVRTGPQASASAAVTDFYLPQNTPLGILIDATNDTIAAIRESSSGSLWYVRVP